MKYILIPYILYNCILSGILVLLMSHSTNWLIEPDWLVITVSFSFLLFTLLSSVVSFLFYYGGQRRLKYATYTLLALSVIELCYVIAFFSFYNSGSYTSELESIPFLLPIILSNLLIWDIVSQSRKSM